MDLEDKTMTGTSDGPETGFTSDYLLYLLAAASEGASAQFHAVVREHGLKVPEWRVLACLAEQDGQMITRLAKIALYEQSRLTRIIEKMEERGLVRREPDEQDGRRVRVYLNDEARALALGLITKARAHEAELMDVIKDSGENGMKSMLQTLIRHLDKDAPLDA